MNPNTIYTYYEGYYVKIIFCTFNFNNMCRIKYFTVPNKIYYDKKNIMLSSNSITKHHIMWIVGVIGKNYAFSQNKS